MLRDSSIEALDQTACAGFVYLSSWLACGLTQQLLLTHPLQIRFCVANAKSRFMQDIFSHKLNVGTRADVPMARDKTTIPKANLTNS